MALGEKKIFILVLPHRVELPRKTSAKTLGDEPATLLFSIKSFIKKTPMDGEKFMRLSSTSPLDCTAPSIN
jgi:hypothetical protein